MNEPAASSSRNTTGISTSSRDAVSTRSNRRCVVLANPSLRPVTRQIYPTAQASTPLPELDDDRALGGAERGPAQAPGAPQRARARDQRQPSERHHTPRAGRNLVRRPGAAAVMQDLGGTGLRHRAKPDPAAPVFGDRPEQST